MYECPNCGGNLKFDITRQQLYCQYCDTSVDPDSFYKEKDAEESTSQDADAEGKMPGKKGMSEYEVTVFTCPQCGGQILSEDTTAATFCSFCGAATILDSRISKERRPDYIIPFTKTEEECRHAYVRMMRRAIFAPSALKDASNIEKFRGIYMPYWVYSFEKKGKITFSGKKTRRKGNYLIIKHYQLQGELDAEYKGFTYDASAAFSDNLSAAIAPFDMKRARSFVPAFLSGFYADTNDVDQCVYKTEIEDIVIEDSCNKLLRKPICKRYDVHMDYELQNAVRPDKCEAKLAMLPVWFLAYRNGDRVCYAAINGQTGKAAADIPIDFKKYLIGSALLTLPLFILLNLFFTFTPIRLLLVVIALGLFCAVIANGQVARLLAKEEGADDKGRVYAGSASNRNDEELADAMAEERERYEKESPMREASDTRIKVRKQMLLFMLAIFVVPQVLLPLLGLLSRTSSGPDILRLLSLFVVVVGLCGIIWVFSFLYRALGISPKKQTGTAYYKGYWKEKLPTLIKPVAAAVLAILILILNPVSDWYYYIGAFVCMAAILWAIADIIKLHNVLSTRSLPQFNRRGGDE